MNNVYQFIISDINLKLSVDPVFVETSLGARVEISCILDSDFNISPVWIREGNEALPSGTNVSYFIRNNSFIALTNILFYRW